MSDDEPFRYRIYRRLIAPFESPLYRAVCMFADDIHDDAAIAWNGENVVMDPLPDSEREIGRNEEQLREIARLAFLGPFIWLLTAMSFRTTRTMQLWVVIAALAFGTLWLATSVGLERPTITGPSEVASDE